MTFLPLLNEPCSFDLLIYTSKAAVVPKKWEDSDPRYIMNSREVKLRSFTTSVSRGCVVVFSSASDSPRCSSNSPRPVPQGGLDGRVQGEGRVGALSR